MEYKFYGQYDCLPLESEPCKCDDCGKQIRNIYTVTNPNNSGDQRIVGYDCIKQYKRAGRASYARYSDYKPR